MLNKNGMILHGWRLTQMITSPPRPPPTRVRIAKTNIGSAALGSAANMKAIVPPPKSSSSNSARESKPKAPLPPLEIYDKRNNKIWARKELLGEGGFAKCFRVRAEVSERPGFGSGYGSGTGTGSGTGSGIGSGDRSINDQIDTTSNSASNPASDPLNYLDSAVKVVWKPSLKSGKQRQKLLSEIKIHQSLSHPNIVTFKGVFEGKFFYYFYEFTFFLDDENVYIILEICENKVSFYLFDFFHLFAL